MIKYSLYFRTSWCVIVQALVDHQTAAAALVMQARAPRPCGMSNGWSTSSEAHGPWTALVWSGPAACCLEAGCVDERMSGCLEVQPTLKSIQFMF